MVHEQGGSPATGITTSEAVTGVTTAPKPAAGGAARQAVTGLTPPQLGEALIREAWPSVVATAAPVAGLAKRLIRSVFLAPLGWLLLGPLFAKGLMPFLARRYTLTNRRLMVQRGLKATPVQGQEVALRDIDDVHLEPDSYDTFYRCGNLEVIRGGQVVLRLPGVPEAESFRHAVLNAVKAWVPEKANGPFIPASATK